MDFKYLEDFAAGDRAVVVEVLGLFLEQAAVWAEALGDADAAWGDLAHTIKGTARGVGARALGDLAELAERDGRVRGGELSAALAEAVAEIEVYLGGATTAAE